MQGKTLSIGLRAVLAIIAATLFVTSTWAAAQERVLHSFGNGTDGNDPLGGLIFDASGNLYGTTLGGGTYGGGAGVRFNAHGGVVLHSFGPADGAGAPAGLVLV